MNSEQPGLSLGVAETDRVAGTYEHAGVAVAFDFTRSDSQHAITFATIDGDPLVTTTLDGAYQTTSVLGGRLVLSGIANAPDPVIEGDRDAMRQLEASREAALLEGLHDALVEAAIDPDLYQPAPPAVASVDDQGNGWYWFYPGDSKVWLSAAGASPTYIYVSNPSPGNCAAVRLNPWSQAPHDVMAVPPLQRDSRTKYWWGAAFEVRNANTWTITSAGLCSTTGIYVRVSPYVPLL